MIWDDKAIDLLRERISEGVKASAIGAEFGVSKNSIIGKAHRLGLSWGPKKPGGPRAAPVQRMIQIRAKPKAKKPRPYRMKALMELLPDECRYIHGHVITGRVFCARPVLVGTPYCAEHMKLCSGGLASSRPRSSEVRAERS